MQRQAFSFLAAVVFVVMACSAVFAFTSRTVVNIPFSFIVDGQTFSAGRYEILEDASSVTPIKIRGVESKEAVIAHVLTRLSQGPGSGTRLVFDKAGEKSYLSEIHIAGIDGFHMRGAPEKHTHVTVNASK